MENCKHRIKLNNNEGYVFCTECGQRWEAEMPTQYKITWDENELSDCLFDQLSEEDKLKPMFLYCSCRKCTPTY